MQPRLEFENKKGPWLSVLAASFSYLGGDCKFGLDVKQKKNFPYNILFLAPVSLLCIFDTVTKPKQNKNSKGDLYRVFN